MWMREGSNESQESPRRSRKDVAVCMHDPTPKSQLSSSGMPEVGASQERKKDKQVSQHSAEVCLPQVRRSQDPSDEDELAEFRCMRGDARAAVQERKRDGTQEVLPRTTTTPVVLKASAGHTAVESRKREEQTEQLSAKDSAEQKIHEKRTKSFHEARCSTAHVSAEVRLHSEGCRESIRQAMVDETCSAKSQSKRSLESYPSVGCSNPETEGRSSHTSL